jgi:hypothetical protein
MVRGCRDCTILWILSIKGRWRYVCHFTKYRPGFPRPTSPSCTYIADGHFLFSRSLVSSSSSDFPEHELAIGLLRNVLLHDKAPCVCVLLFFHFLTPNELNLKVQPLSRSLGSPYRHPTSQKKQVLGTNALAALHTPLL